MLLLSLALALPVVVQALSLDVVRRDLGSRLSKSALISTNGKQFARWSDYRPPTPGVVVGVASETDVAVTVQYCTEYDIPFVAQAGGHGFTDIYDVGNDGILIDMRKLNSVTFSDDKKEVTIGGGTIISEVIETASANGALVMAGNCNCVGTVGAILGGGYGNLMGLYGFSVDNVLSLNVVTADGALKTVTADDDHDGLFWALRGAGPNFGIVTSVKMKSYPVDPSGQRAWLGALTFTGDKIEAIAKAIDELTFRPEMNILVYFLDARAPEKKPTILATPFYYGTEAEGRAAFASILDIGPTLDTTAETNYTHWNDGAEGACTKGGRKPSYTVGLGKLVPETWKQVWDEYVAWVSSNDGAARNSIVMVEAYSMDKAHSFPLDSAALPWRGYIKFTALLFPWYEDESLDQAAILYATKTRRLLKDTSGLDPPATYVNFAHGDEDPEEIFGSHLPKLQRLKAKFDPNNIFDQSFYLGPPKLSVVKQKGEGN